VATGYVSDLEESLKQTENLENADESSNIEVGVAAYHLGKAHLEKGELYHAGLLLSRALEIHQRERGADHPTTLEIKSDLQTALVASKRANTAEEREKLTVSNDYIPYFEPMVESLRAAASTAAPGAASAAAPAAAPASEAADPTAPVKAQASEPASKPDPGSTPVQSSISEIESMEQAVREVYALRRSTAPSLALADALVKLAGIYSQHAMLEDMEPLLKEALEIREAICGPRHLSVSTDLKNLGRLFYFMGKYVEAEPMLRRSMSIRQASLGLHHPYVAEVAEWYARLLWKTNRTVEADEMETLVRESREKFGGEWEMYRLAATKAADKDDLFLARGLWLAALEEAKDFRYDDPRLSLTLESLAEVYWRQSKYDKAEPICKRILQIWESKLGSEHSDVGKAAKNLAMVCERQGKHVEAAILYQQVLSITEKNLGRSHPEVLASRESCAKARQMAQKQVELKVAKLEGRWNRSGWYQACPKEND
jgi:tetratricopeptide (TPR) repeat protein